MKFIVLALFAFFGYTLAVDQCEISLLADSKTDKLANLPSTCAAQVIQQIKEEASASYKYFQMGAYFSSDQVNLPGFAELFFKAAKEERDHSAILMSYLSTRLSKKVDIENVQANLLSQNVYVDLNGFNGLKALQQAYDMEKYITGKIKSIITACDSVNDKEYHVSDFLTGDFLTEQYESERNFAGKLATLEKMWEHHGSLSEFMFDKTL